jgi:hypothetical protein
MSDDEELCPDGLKPGMVVKDETGARKVVIRIRENMVFWRYLGPASEAELRREHSTRYEDFEDTHFVTAETAPVSKVA